MIKLISDLPFIVSMLIMMTAFVKGFILPFSYKYEDDPYGWAATIGLFNVIGIFLVSIAFFIAVDTAIHPYELEEYVFQIYFLTMALAIYLLSVKIEKSILDYCIKKGVVRAKE